MDEGEFERNMESARALLSGLTSTVENSANESSSSSKPIEYAQQALNQGEKDSTRQLHISREASATKSGSKVDPHMNDQASKTKSMSISDLEEKGAAVILKEDSFKNIIQEFPYVFANFGDLTLHDVEDLLNNYKKLVFKYVCLAKGLGVAPSPPSIPQGQTMEGSERDREKETIEDHHRKHDEPIGRLDSEVGISESSAPQEDDAGASLKGEETSEVVVPTSGNSEAEVPQEGVAAASSIEPNTETAPQSIKE